MARNIESLTALRGLAALTVLTYHCGARLFGGVEHVPLPLSHGYLAVDLFFLLSGFVLMHVHEREFGDGVAWANIKSFLRARFARTYPIHAVVLLVMLPLYGMRPEFSGVALAHSLLLTQAPWLDQISWNVPAWSISAEWHAYLLFPFLVMPWRRRSRAATIVILLLCLATLSLAVIASGNCADIYYSPVVLLRCLPEFIAGMGLYRAYREGWLARWMTGDRAAAAAAMAVIGLAWFAGTDIALIVGLACLLLACAHNRGVAASMLTTRLPMFLGRISYSLYMVQTISDHAGYAIAKPRSTPPRCSH
jgi:peptidoglycan/LPS O-acetylase OafA/YrhL